MCTYNTAPRERKITVDFKVSTFPSYNFLPCVQINLDQITVLIKKGGREEVTGKKMNNYK